MTDREKRIADALASGPDACVALAVELARPFVQPARGTKKARPPKLAAPPPLASFFAALGATTAVGKQDRLVAPADRALDGQKLRFAEENQGVCTWACDVEGDDPPVYCRHHRASAWADEHVSLSVFLLRFATIEALFGDAEAQSAPCLPDDALAAMLSHLRPLPFPDASWPEAPTRLYARGGVLALVSPNGDGVSSVWVTAASRDELAFLDGLADDAWD